MATSFVNVGSIANDGTGDPLRTAFITINDNFNTLNGALFAGTVPTLITAVGVTTDYLIANTLTTTDFIANTVTSNGNLFVSKDGATIYGNVKIIGNLEISGSQIASGASQQTASPQTQLHFSSTPLTTDDNKDIGTQWQYYTTIEQKAFFGWQNSTGSLVYLDNITEVSNVITSGTPGNVQFGSLLLSNTTSSTSNVTGALVVDGGVGIGENLNVQGNVFVGQTANVGNLSVRGFVSGSLNLTGADTIYINGSPVATAASSFSGGAVAFDAAFASGSLSVSPTTGAVVVPYGGGLGVSGNINVGGNINIDASSGINGNIYTAAQPHITSVGELTSLNMGGQLNSQNVIPEINNTYNLGGPSNRWNKMWAFDADVSGTLNATAITAAGGTYTGNIAINTPTAAGLTTTTTVAELFNTGATTVRIGGAGVTQFRNNTQATSTTSGAVQVTGGMSINTGSLYIGGSNGNAIVTTNDIYAADLITTSNAQSISTSTGAIVVNGGVGIATGNLYVSGSEGNAAVLNGNVWVIGHVLPGGANVSKNLGSSTSWWNTFYGVSTQAKYADLAENYVADEVYPAGTVVVFGGSKEITTTTHLADHRVAGVISTNPAHLMNGQLQGATVLPVALRGRVPVNVVGPVAKGDLLVTSDLKGHAVSVGSDTSYGAKVFAKSLDTNGDLGQKTIEAVIL